ncbi:putative secreted hydrolase [Sphingomonas sp. SORGH_AS802]|uniref:lipocalin-like domain-containing protein n=1 Tax=unclassified Sphingomonas TaxID=196159 RepID=UPI00286625DB|nr:MULTISPECIES: carotenoid 1,2-hydratase [unclassified Sphingomonas]MDR6126865.1 putative secreted hydrolase [Sphingomonas sp. SORGH_AS_0438]MDR6134773.1 putative secreted hydrolase [Sphingomonas sp. SORGH_AS_0802]
MRAFLALVAAAGLAAPSPYPVVRPGIRLSFPADHGAHPAFRTEWWYVTGWLKGEDGRDIGFQITFFRVNPHAATDNPSRFAARQVIFAHAALSDSRIGHILHAERAARAGFGLAGAATGDADVRLNGWTFRRLRDGRFTSRVGGRDFTLDLSFRPTQPPLAQGENGYSRKGPKPAQASYYYSMPHLAASGTLVRAGRRERLSGEAWLDREWSSDYLATDAAGWDWTGLNLDDGAALMAFRIRRKGGGVLWSGGSYRRPDGRITRLSPRDVAFSPRATWRSARTGARYPVAQLLRIRLPEGIRAFLLRPVFADQEVDARAAGQPVYWEGAVRTNGGRGYLELTGYTAPLRM